MIEKKTIYALAFTAMALSACGGGSGGSSSQPTSPAPAPTPSPPPTSEAPDFKVNVDRFAFEDGWLFFNIVKEDGFYFDSVIIEQTSGTPASFQRSLGSQNKGQELWKAPSYPGVACETISFEITVTNEGLSRTKSVLIDIEADDLPGLPVGRYSGDVRLMVDSAGNIGPDRPPDHVMITQEDGSTLDEVKFIGGPYRYFGIPMNFNRFSKPAANAFFTEVEHINFDSLNFNLHPAPIPEFTVLDKEDDVIRWFFMEDGNDRDDDFNQIYSESESSISIEDPCFIRRQMSSTDGFIWVGHEDNGISLVSLEGIPSEGGLNREFVSSSILNTPDTRTICYIYPTVIHQDIIPPLVNGETPKYQSAIGIDGETNELVIYGDLRDGGPDYREITSIPIQTETNEILKVVDVFSRGEPSRVPRYLIILLSDGKDNGIHRLVYVTQESGMDDVRGRIAQKTYRWDGPPPISLHSGPMGGAAQESQYDLDIAVMTSGNIGLFFDHKDGGISNPPEYQDPITFPIASGGREAVSVTSDSGITHEVLVNYPASRTMRLYSVSDQLPTP